MADKDCRNCIHFEVCAYASHELPTCDTYTEKAENHVANGDLISRAALLAEYERVHVGPPGRARKLIEDAPAIDRMISVKERLPEKSGLVLAYDLHYGFQIFYFGKDELRSGWQGVTHWMPLPSGPEEDV